MTITVRDETSSRNSVFISYRRSDSEMASGRLSDDLARDLGTSRVFQDRQIQGGRRYPDRLYSALDAAAVILVVIGPTWLAAAKNGTRRIDDEADWVHREIRYGIASEDKVLLVPVLLDGAELLTPSELPPQISDLAFRQSLPLRTSDWGSDYQRILDVIRAHTAWSKARKKVWLTVALACLLSAGALIALTVQLRESKLTEGRAQSILPISLDGNFNVAVAQVLGPDGDSNEGENDPSQSFFRTLSDRIQALSSPRLDVQLVGPDSVGMIEGSNPDERALFAQRLAIQINADIIIYGGAVTEVDGSTSQQVEFLLMPTAFGMDDGQLSGPYGNYRLAAIEVGNLAEDRTARELLRRQLNEQVAALATFVEGMIHYDAGEYEQAATRFRGAQQSNNWPKEGGRDIAAVFLGNTLGRLTPPDFAQASDAYLEALETSDGLQSRALVGLAEIDYHRASGCSEDASECCASPDQRGLEVAEQQFLEALEFPTPATADIAEKVNIGLARVEMCQLTVTEEPGSSPNYLSSIEKIEERLERVVSSYKNAPTDADRFRKSTSATTALGLQGAILEWYYEPPRTSDASEKYLQALGLTTIPDQRIVVLQSIVSLYSRDGQCSSASRFYTDLEDAATQTASDIEQVQKLFVELCGDA